jgi:hypothetical protein
MLVKLNSGVIKDLHSSVAAILIQNGQGVPFTPERIKIDEPAKNEKISIEQPSKRGRKPKMRYDIANK